MNNVKNYILEDKVEEKKISEKKKKSSSKPKATYEIVLSADPDFVIRRKTAKTSNLLVILITQEQYYIKNEKNGEINFLDEMSFRKFFQHLPDEGLQTGVEWTSNIKNWINHPESRELFMAVLTGENFKAIRSLIKQKYIRINPRKEKHTYRRNFFRKNLCEINRAFEKTECSSVFSALKDIFDKEHIRMYLSRYVLQGRYYDENRMAQGVSDIVSDMAHETDNHFLESTVHNLFSCFGQSGLRTFLSEWFNCPANEKFPEALYFGQLMNRSDTIEGTYDYRIRRFGKGTEKRKFKFDTFKNYIIYECVKQGMGYKPNEFIKIWDDVLSMQEILYGKIICKYPENLMTYHDQLSYKTMIMMRNKEIEGLAERYNELEKFKWANDKYLIRPPKDKADMLDEAVMQANCLSSYVTKHAIGETSIFFMRDRNEPDVSLITIEIRSNRLVQAKRSRNASPTPEQLDVIYRWCNKCGFSY